MLTLAGVTVFSLFQANKIRTSSNEIADNWLPSISNLAGMKYALADERVYLYRHISVTDSSEVAFMNFLLSVEGKRFEFFRKRYESLISLEQEQENYVDLIESLKEYQVISKRLLAYSSVNQDDKAVQVLCGDSKQLYDMVR